MGAWEILENRGYDTERDLYAGLTSRCRGRQRVSKGFWVSATGKSQDSHRRRFVRPTGASSIERESVSGANKYPQPTEARVRHACVGIH